MTPPRYTTREVDGSEEDIAEELQVLNFLTFGAGSSSIDPSQGYWWLAYRDQSSAPVAFAGLIPSTYVKNAGYFCRVGVLEPHRGNNLQSRLMARIEAKARLCGWKQIISDTTDNPASANNFIKRGWRIYSPPVWWAFSTSIYWRKIL